MKRLFIFALFLTVLSTSLWAQDLYHSKTSYIKFFSDAPLEDIEAENKTATSFLNIKTGDMVFKVKIIDFQFAQSLMQEHFNENYMETEKYPESTFKGKVLNINEIDLTQAGKHEVEIEGELTIHGKTKTYKTKGTLARTADEIAGDCVFKVKLADHKIKIPRVVFKNIAEIVEVTVKMTYNEYHKK